MTIIHKVKFVLIFLSLIHSSIPFSKEKPKSHDFKRPFVKIPSLGCLKGTIGRTTWTNRIFYQYLGIKYAESPSGPRRFKAPVGVQPWKGIKNATVLGQNCVTGGPIVSIPPQTSNDIEDCLNMNIFTPKPSSKNSNKKRYPVMICIHGGFFSIGSSASYPPNYLMERDIVLVVPNFRLDALGFLSTKSDEIPGNAGMLDVLFVIKWVKRNIKYFGGDPHKITVMGQSSGAVMVSSLILSPLVPKNLIQRMIIHSGSVFAPWAFADDPVAYAKDIAKRANVPETDSFQEINDAFMKMNVYELINATNAHYTVGQVNGLNHVGGRSLTIGGPSNYMPFSPKDLVQMGFYKDDIELLTGNVKNEGSFLAGEFYDYLKSVGLLDNPEFMTNLFIPTVVNTLGEPNRQSELIELANNIFAKQISSQDTNFVDFASGFSELTGTVGLKVPVLQLAQANLLNSPCRTYLYTFDYRGAFTRFASSQYPFDGGVGHTDDLIYLFPFPPAAANLNQMDTKIAKKMVNLWTSFVKKGIPKLKNNSTFYWPKFENSRGPYLHINSNFSVGNDYYDEYKIGL